MLSATPTILAAYLLSALAVGQDYYEQGLQAKAEGNYEKALRIWTEARHDEQIVPDLRIATTYLELATRKKLRGYYPEGQDLYGWALSAGQLAGPDLEAIKEEFKRLEPLLDRDTRRAWEDLLDERDPELLAEFARFWTERDPTPGRVYNERLFEHWERIAYAREHFDLRDNPPYGTDDRGKVWVQYGEPDRTRKGELVADRGRVASVCKQLRGCSDVLMPDVVMNLDLMPRYEIWIYDQPDPRMEHNLVYIFGETALNGFRRVNAVEDFIPARAFTLNRNRFRTGRTGNPVGWINPGMVMQWIYYEQLATLDGYFAGRFNELAFIWDRVGPDERKHISSGMIQRDRSRHQARQIQRQAPEQQSTLDEQIPDIPLHVYPYRMLDEDNRPYYAAFMQSRPHQPLLEDAVANQDRMLAGADDIPVTELTSYYELIHELQLRDEDGQILSNRRMPADIIMDVDHTVPGETLFNVPFVPRDGYMKLVAELYNRHPDGQPAHDSPFPDELRALGHADMPLPEPLDLHANRPTLSDLILGYDLDEAAGDNNYPFLPSHEQKIRAGENLVVHFETYGLQPGDDGFSNFELDYAIRPAEDRGWLRRLFGSGDPRPDVALTLSFESGADRYSENLEIETRELDPGDYLLEFTVTDRHSGGKAGREVEISIVE